MAYEQPDSDKSAAAIAPDWLKGKGGKDKRKKYGERIAEYCTAYETQIGRLRPRWKETDDAAVNKYRETLKRPWPTAPVYHFPVVRPKLMQGTDFVANPLTQSDPYVIVKGGGMSGKRAYPVERTLHMFNARAVYAEMVRYVMDIIQRRGKAWIRATYNVSDLTAQRKQWPGVQHDVFAPEQMRMFPAHANKVDEMLFIGHEYTTTVGEIQRRQKSGLFFKDKDFIGVASLDEWNDKLLQDRGDRATRFEESPVRCVEGFMRFDEDDEQRWYQVTIDPVAEHILRCKYYPHRAPWYIDCSDHVEYMRAIYENSRGSDLTGPQYYSNDIRNLTTWLAMWNGMKPMFAQNGALPDDIQAAQPGMLYPLAYGGQLFTPQGSIDITGLRDLIQLAQIDSDFASGLSSQAGGTSRGGSLTATEIMRVGQGQDMAVSGDMIHVGFGLSRLAEFTTCDLLWTYYDDWNPAFAEMLPKTSQDDFDRPYWFEANGQSPSMPQVVFGQVNEMILALSNLMRISPELAIRYPELVPGLLRTALEQINAAAKDTMMPQEEEDEGADTAMGQMYGGISPLANGIPGMGVPGEAMGGSAFPGNGQF